MSNEFRTLLGSSFNLFEGLMRASDLRSDARSTIGLAEFDASSVRASTNIEINKLKRRTGKILSTQRGQIGRTGLSPTSKSFLAVMNDTISDAESEVRDHRNLAQNRINGIVFRAQVQASRQKRAARNQTINSIFGFISDISGLI